MRALAVLLAVLLLTGCGAAEESSDRAPADPDGGVELGFAAPPRSNVSHYSWSQGCGCSSSDALQVAMLGILLLRRRAR